MIAQVIFEVTVTLSTEKYRAACWKLCLWRVLTWTLLMLNSELVQYCYTDKWHWKSLVLYNVAHILSACSCVHTARLCFVLPRSFYKILQASSCGAIASKLLCNIHFSERNAHRHLIFLVFLQELQLIKLSTAYKMTAGRDACRLLKCLPCGINVAVWQGDRPAHAPSPSHWLTLIKMD